MQDAYRFCECGSGAKFKFCCSKKNKAQSISTQTVKTITVTWEPVFTPEDYPLDTEDHTAYEGAHNLLQHSPKKAIPILRKLIAKHPDVPLLLNNLSAAYQLSGDKIKANELGNQLRAKFPNYLFGRIAKAQDCLIRDEFNLIPEIFDHKYDLKSLYPQRDVFHVSEVVGFGGIMGQYFVKIGKLDTAKIYLQMLKGIDPDNQITRSLDKMISLNEMQAIFEKIVNEGSRLRKNRTALLESARETR